MAYSLTDAILGRRDPNQGGKQLGGVGGAAVGRTGGSAPSGEMRAFGTTGGSGGSRANEYDDSVNRRREELEQRRRDLVSGGAQPDDPEFQNINRQLSQMGGPGLPPGAFNTTPQWQNLWDAMDQGQSAEDVFSMIGRDFRGYSEDDLKNFLEHPAWRQFMAMGLKKTPQWQQMDALRFPSEQILSAGMGQIGAAGQQATRQGMQALQQTGMGRNAGAIAALNRQQAVATGQAGATLGAQVGEQAFRSEMARLGEMLRLEQGMQALALGQSPGRTQQDDGASTGDWLALLGTLAGGALAACWVAREVYGVTNPRWLLFRSWLMSKAPVWFRKLYIRHGERFAKIVRMLPWLKRPIRRWMDKRIAAMEGTWSIL